jgi:hypothetical protein
MKRRFIGFTLLALIAGPAPCGAQLNGENVLGDHGVMAGTQPAPGFYASLLYSRYDTDTIKNGAGERITVDPSRSGSLASQAIRPTFTWVSPYRLLGGHYGATAMFTLANAEIEAPTFGLDRTVSTGPGDLYVMPVQLGWRLVRADAIAAFAFVAPTGRFEAGASDNLGKGMWSYEFSGGGTMYLDEKKSLSLASSAFWELHSKKSGEVTLGPSTLTDVKVGQILTLEGGLGKSFREASVGAAYYAQWKLTEDEFDFTITPPGGAVIGKHRVWGFGPEVTIPVIAGSKLISLLNLRYMWETGARIETEGRTLLVTASFPLPSSGTTPGM